MSAVLLFGIFFALLFLNVPIAMSLGVSSIITTMAVKPAMMSTIAANLYSSTNTYVLLAIPFLLFYDRTVLPLCNRCLPRQECTCMPTATAL